MDSLPHSFTSSLSPRKVGTFDESVSSSHKESESTSEIRTSEQYQILFDQLREESPSEYYRMFPPNDTVSKNKRGKRWVESSTILHSLLPTSNDNVRETAEKFSKDISRLLNSAISTNELSSLVSKMRRNYKSGLYRSFSASAEEETTTLPTPITYSSDAAAHDELRKEHPSEFHQVDPTGPDEEQSLRTTFRPWHFTTQNSITTTPSPDINAETTTVNKPTPHGLGRPLTEQEERILEILKVREPSAYHRLMSPIDVHEKIIISAISNSLQENHGESNVITTKKDYSYDKKVAEFFSDSEIAEEPDNGEENKMSPSQPPHEVSSTLPSLNKEYEPTFVTIAPSEATTETTATPSWISFSTPPSTKRPLPQDVLHDSELRRGNTNKYYCSSHDGKPCHSYANSAYVSSYMGDSSDGMISFSRFRDRYRSKYELIERGGEDNSLNKNERLSTVKPEFTSSPPTTATTQVVNTNTRTTEEADSSSIATTTEPEFLEDSITIEVNSNVDILESSSSPLLTSESAEETTTIQFSPKTETTTPPNFEETTTPSGTTSLPSTTPMNIAEEITTTQLPSSNFGTSVTPSTMLTTPRQDDVVASKSDSSYSKFSSSPSLDTKEFLSIFSFPSSDSINSPGGSSGSNYFAKKKIPVWSKHSLFDIKRTFKPATVSEIDSVLYSEVRRNDEDSLVSGLSSNTFVSKWPRHAPSHTANPEHQKSSKKSKSNEKRSSSSKRKSGN